MVQPLKKPKLPQSVQNALKKAEKFKYAFLVLLVGIVLLLLPHGSKTAEPAQPAEELTQTQELTQLEQTRQALQSLLQQIDGVGEVRLLLSLEAGAEKVIWTDREESRTADTVQKKETAVFSQNGSDRQPVVTKSYYPVYKGAVVVCQGADNASVRLAVTQAVSGLTGLGSDKISVVKMKQQQEEAT